MSAPIKSTKEMNIVHPILRPASCHISAFNDIKIAPSISF